MLPYLLWILFGGIVGWLATLLPRGPRQRSPVVNVVAGVFGSTMGGCVYDQAARDSGATLASLLAALTGAAIAVTAIHAFPRRARR